MPLTRSSVPTLSHLPSTGAWFRSARQALSTWRFRRRSRNALARLAVHQLRDIGLDALSASAEAAKPFWKD